MQVTAATSGAYSLGTTVGDMRQFCERQPDVCVVGSQAAVTIGQRAQAGAKMLYEFLNEQLGPAETGTVTSTASTSAALMPTFPISGAVIVTIWPK